MISTGKVALLASVGFIFAMSWLVSQVARPIVELNTPLVANAQDSRGAAEAFVSANAARRSVESSNTDEVRKQFQVASTLVGVNEPAQRNADVLVMNEEVATLGTELPPMYVPAEPIVARSEFPIERPWNRPVEAIAPDESVFASAVPEAIYEESTPSHPTLLMALNPEETTGAGIGWEMAAREPAAPRPQMYTVKSGDTLRKIIKQLWNRTDKQALELLLAANPDLAKRKDRIFPGEELVVPDLLEDATMLASARSARDDDAMAAETANSQSSDYRWYIVKKKDSLAAIAKRHLNDASRWREIAELNQIRNVDRLMPGSKIKLPVGRIDT